MTAAQPVTVEQLNEAQWHAVVPGRRIGGVGSYIAALSDGLIWGTLDDRPVETVALDGTRMLMCAASIGLRGATWVM